jgi:hypothetical protein
MVKKSSGMRGALPPCRRPPRNFNQSVKDITLHEATLNGELVSMGTADSVNLYFEYGTDTDYGNKTRREPNARDRGLLIVFALSFRRTQFITTGQ